MAIHAYMEHHRTGTGFSFLQYHFSIRKSDQKIKMNIDENFNLIPPEVVDTANARSLSLLPEKKAECCTQKIC